MKNYQRMIRTISYAGEVFYIGTSRDDCMQRMPKQPLVGPNVETVLEVQVIALEVSLDVQDMQEVSRHPMVEQEIPKQPVAWLLEVEYMCCCSPVCG